MITHLNTNNMIRNYLYRFITVSAICLSTYAVQAQLQVSKLFTDGVILQRDVAMPIWGKAAASESVSVTIGDITETAVADADGNWEVEISAHVAGGPHAIVIKTDGDEQIDISDVYFGDVWMAAGQSNMEWTLSNSDGGADEIAVADDGLQREFKIQKGLSKELSDELPSASWSSATSSDVKDFSAVAYYFAKDLRAQLDIPVGIVNNSYGGARIEAFMSEEMLGYNSTQVVLQGGTYKERQPTMIYNKMVNPLLRFPFKGIIWYQGESNADHLDDAKAYGELFQKMINSWREEMGQGDIPFIWVQLPNSAPENDEAEPLAWDAWPQMRAGQSRALRLPNTGEATAIDLGEEDIHPTNKKPVGERLALVARNLVYGEDIAYSGPRLKSYSIDGSTVTIDFDFVEDGLKAAEDGSVKWFSIAGADGALYIADAVIEGNQVKVSSANVSAPAIVRYAWEQHPAGVNLYNSADLPAVPFYIYVNDGEFAVNEDLESQTVERGNRVDFNWEIFGAAEITINDIAVDSVSAATYFPMETTDYTIKAINANDETDVYTNTVTVTVVDPQPTISLSTDLGTAVSPNTTLSIKADAQAPGGGTVVSVEFFIDGVSLMLDEEAPYGASWTPADLAEYEITAVVTDANGNATTSVPYNVLVSNLELVILEAEDGVLKGDASVKSAKVASGRKYVDVLQDWKIEMPTFISTEAGTYTMSIRYMLNYQGPKSQILYVNGKSKGEVEFTAPDNTSWMVTTVDVPVVKGENTIAFETSWGWMSFDYVSFVAEPGTFTVGGDVVTGNEPVFDDVKIYPLPAYDNLVVEYGNLIGLYSDVELASINGVVVLKEQLKLNDGKMMIDTTSVPEGVYILKINNGESTVMKQIIIRH